MIMRICSLGCIILSLASWRSVQGKSCNRRPKFAHSEHRDIAEPILNNNHIATTTVHGLAANAL